MKTVFHDIFAQDTDDVLVFDHDSITAEDITEFKEYHGLHSSSIRQFLDTLEKQKSLVTEFDATQFQSLVDFITVYSKEDIRVTFRNGMEIKV